MTNEARFFLGIPIAALIPSFVLAVASPGLGADFSHPSSIGLLALVLYPPSVAFTAFFAVPTFYLLRRLGLIRWWLISIAGLGGGVLADSAFTGFRWTKAGWLAQDLPGLLLWSIAGLASALVVWAFWRSAR